MQSRDMLFFSYQFHLGTKYFYLVVTFSHGLSDVQGILADKST